MKEESDIDHEKLDGLLGGDNTGHYHLTSEEISKLQNIPADGIQGVKGDKGDKGDKGNPASVTSESCMFTLENGSTTTKKVAIAS